MNKVPQKPLPAGARPSLSGIPNPTCPVMLEAGAVLEKARDLHRAIRKLRQSTQRCLTCPENTECPTMRDLAQAVDQAIRDVRREWGLDQE